ncbi:MAG: uroporphyrinogen decarboxylase family protein [Clostridia bacterium]|nr:uroporphyrinogen decarboxylase family protein [Clostridia bacterium]
MNSRERLYAAINYEPFDRMPTHYYGTPEIHKALMEELDVDSKIEIYERLGADLRHVSPDYIGPELKRFEDGSREGLHGEIYSKISFGHGTYDEPSYLPFENVDDPEDLTNHRFPSADWYDYSKVKKKCKELEGFPIEIEGAGTPDFINGIARYRGVQKVMYDIALEDPVFLGLVERRHEFLIEKTERTLKAADGLVDIVGMGEDLGNQNGLLISPDSYDRLFREKHQAFIDLAHKHGAVAMMHCCGSCRKLIPTFIEMGLDILEVVQVDAAGMDITELHDEFYGKIAFCGSISVQHTLPWGTVDDVVREVELRKKLFGKGGMIIAPTHAIQAGTPVENILALYKTIPSFKE